MSTLFRMLILPETPGDTLGCFLLLFGLLLFVAFAAAVSITVALYVLPAYAVFAIVRIELQIRGFRAEALDRGWNPPESCQAYLHNRMVLRIVQFGWTLVGVGCVIAIVVLGSPN